MEDTSKRGFEYYLNEVKYLNEYRSRFKCSGCGRLLSSGSCFFCDKEIENENTKRDIEGIIERINFIVDSLPKEAYFNETITTLSRMADIDIVKKYLVDINYNEIIEKEKNRINNLFDESKGLTKQDSKNFELIYSNCSNGIERDNYSVFVVRERLLKRSEFSDLFFEKSMKRFIEVVGKVSGLAPMSYEVMIADLEEKTHGEVINGFLLKIDRERIRSLYNNASFDAIATIYHEVRHLLQTQKYDEFKKPSFDTFMMLKENIISTYSNYYYKEYYQSNYSKILFELDAQYAGITGATQFVDNVEINIDDVFKKKLNEQLQNILLSKEDYSRTVEGIEYTVDDYFDLFISDKPELLEKYFYLKYQYVSEEGIKVRKRQTQEVVQDLLNFDYSGMSEEEALEAKIFFAKILSSMQVEKEEQLTSSAKK